MVRRPHRSAARVLVKTCDLGHNTGDVLAARGSVYELSSPVGSTALRDESLHRQPSLCPKLCCLIGNLPRLMGQPLLPPRESAPPEGVFLRLRILLTRLELGAGGTIAPMSRADIRSFSSFDWLAAGTAWHRENGPFSVRLAVLTQLLGAANPILPAHEAESARPHGGGVHRLVDPSAKGGIVSCL